MIQCVAHMHTVAMYVASYIIFTKLQKILKENFSLSYVKDLNLLNKIYPENFLPCNRSYI